ncbi:MAG: YkgJ family cysteine cluster protein [Candidatus Bathyarchaeota archaeon]|nr:YkgJ family cysteine cluster protein [Candidatus Termiticorpusculum sp.]
MRSTLQAIYKLIPQKTDCQNCGGCCGNIVMTRLEMQNIIQFCEENNLTFQHPVTLVHNFIRKQVKKTCPQKTDTFTEKLDSLASVMFERESDGQVTFNIPLGASCPLLTCDNKCSVYPVRPFICRLYGHVKGLDCQTADPQKHYTFTEAEANRLCRQAREAWQ